MPFWLFAIMTAIVSYIIVLIIASNTGLGGVTNNIDVPISVESIEPENVSVKPMSPVPLNKNINGTRKRPTELDMKQGYYILDTNETMKTGIPKYIFLGPEAPNLIYRNQTGIDLE
jgi:hypothetical protein